MSEGKPATTKLDWSRPIQFADGEPLELLDTKPNGERVVLRLNEPFGLTAIWTVAPDGRCAPGSLGDIANKHVVNRT